MDLCSPFIGYIKVLQHVKAFYGEKSFHWHTVLDTLNNTRETLTQQAEFLTLQDRAIRWHLTVNQQRDFYEHKPPLPLEVSFDYGP